MFKSEMTIRTKFMLSFLGLVLIPLLITPVIGFVYSSNLLKSKLTIVTEQSMDNIEENINHVVNHMISASNVLVLDESVQEALLNPVDTSIERVLRNRYMENRLHYMEASVLLTYQVESILLDLKGNLYQTNPEKRYDYESMIQSDWYQHAIEANGKFVWNTAIDPSREGFSMSRYIKKEYYLPTSVLAIRLIPDRRLYQLLERTNDFDGTKRYLLNSHGEQILSTDETALIPELFEFAMETGKPSVLAYNGEKVFFSMRKIEKTDWLLIQTIPYDAVMSDIHVYRNFTLLFNVLFFGLILWVAYLLSQNITKAIHQLSEGMQKVTQGDLSVEMDVSGSLEVNQLNDSFNYMMDRIQGLIHEVKIETQQKEKVKLQALQAQINPHFLLNTLNGIKWLCVIENAKTAEKMLLSLGHLLENSLGKYDDFVTLEAEIACLKSYIDLQKMRYGNRFEVVFDIEEATLKTKVPVLLLQPIVENAILHAFESCDEKGQIDIVTQMREDFVEIWIVDHGKGMSESQVQAILNPDTTENKHGGIGILNVKERVELYYEDPCTLLLESQVGEGTKVLLLIKA